MTNKERQASLDKQKYIESEKQGKDMRGKMLWCESCEDNPFCVAYEQERIESECICAKAYNRMKRKSKDYFVIKHKEITPQQQKRVTKALEKELDRIKGEVK